MKIWVSGSEGMLGKRVVAAGQAAGHTVIPSGSWCDIAEPTHVAGIIKNMRPDAVINCAGLLPGPGRSPAAMARVNAYGPQLLAAFCEPDIRLVHMSTDAVFSGFALKFARFKGYVVGDPTDPLDVYGRTKLAGEPESPNVIVVRGSFIGPEHGLLAWLMAQQGDIEGWANAWWTGTTVWEMARLLVRLAESQISGTIHAATENKISKGALLALLAYRLRVPVRVVQVEEPRIDRALAPTLPETTHPAIDQLLYELMQNVLVAR